MRKGRSALWRRGTLRQVIRLVAAQTMLPMSCGHKRRARIVELLHIEDKLYPERQMSSTYFTKLATHYESAATQLLS